MVQQLCTYAADIRNWAGLATNQDLGLNEAESWVSKKAGAERAMGSEGVGTSGSCAGATGRTFS